MSNLNQLVKNFNSSCGCNGIDATQLALLAAFIVVIGDIIALIAASVAVQENNKCKVNAAKNAEIVHQIEQLEQQICCLKKNYKIY